MNVLAFLLAGYFLSVGSSGSPGAEGGGVQTGVRTGVRIGVQIGVQIDKADLRVCCEKIIRGEQRIWFLSDRNGKMKLQVKGIYIHGTVLLFLLRLTNRSSRDYSVDGIRFEPSDRDGGVLYGPRSHTGAGRVALEPVYVYDSTKMVPGNSSASSIFVLPRFTLPSGGKLWIEMREANGGRFLHIPVNNWMLARARLI